MNFPDGLFPPDILWPFNLLAAWLVWDCVRKAPWKRLAKSSMQNLWATCIIVLMMFWSIKAGIRPGLNFHLLGATLLTLMFGMRLAILALVVVLVAVTLTGAAGWQSLGVNFMVMGLLPAIFSYACYSQAYHKLPNHAFIYIFLNAFLVAGLSVMLVGLADAMLLSWSGAYKREVLEHDYLPYFILMAWPEAILTGMAVSLMVAYRPGWLSTFCDRRYIQGK